MRMLRKVGVLLMILVGIVLLYSASWIVAKGIWPEVLESGWSLSGSSMILNHVWKGNELYIPVTLYIVIGLGLVVGGAIAWKRLGVAGQELKGKKRVR